MIKITGMILVICACWGMGFYKASFLTNRVKALEKMLLFIKSLGDEMRYTMQPIQEILHKFSYREEFKPLYFLKKFRQCDMLTSFSLQWANAVKETTQSDFEKEDLEVIASLGEVIGTSDIEGQMLYLEHFKSLVQEQLNRATEKKEKYAQMYKTLGLLLGMGAAILMI